jgi:hypothetical protein
MFNGSFEGFLEGYSIQSTPTYVDLTLNLSPAKFSLPVDYGDYTLAQTITNAGTTTYTVPDGVNQIAVLAKGYGGNGANGTASSTVNGGAGGGGGGGAKAPLDFEYTGGVAGGAGGAGGNALNNGALNGFNATSPTGTGNGGSGGGGGAYQQTFGNGSGGTATTATGAVVYIYTR